MRRDVVVRTIAIALVLVTGRAYADEAERCATEAEEGQAARATGKLRAAREHVISCSRESCPRIIRADCSRWLTEIETELPTIVVRARDGRGVDLSEVTVFVDNVQVSERVDGRPISLDVGPHELRFEKRSSSVATSRASQHVVVRTGERGRIVTVSFEDGSAASKSGVGPIVLGGVGLALGAGGTVLWALARSDHADLESTCAPTGTCASSDITDGKTKLIIGDVAVAAGILAVAGAVYWYFASSGSSRSPQARALPSLTF